jgi:hypothetical protein
MSDGINSPWKIDVVYFAVNITSVGRNTCDVLSGRGEMHRVSAFVQGINQFFQKSEIIGNGWNDEQ